MLIGRLFPGPKTSDRDFIPGPAAARGRGLARSSEVRARTRLSRENHFNYANALFIEPHDTSITSLCLPILAWHENKSNWGRSNSLIRLVYRPPIPQPVNRRSSTPHLRTSTMPPRRAPQNGYRRGGKQAYHGPRKAKTFASKSGTEATSADEKREAVKLAHSIDEAQGFARYESGKKRTGWLVNLKSTSIEDEKVPEGRAGLDCYFIEEDGGTFKATLEYDPYFLVAVKRGHEAEAEEWLKRAPGGGVVKSLKKVDKEDLQMPNHLLGYRRTFFELRFSNVGDLLAARRDIMPIAERNKKNMNAMDTYAEVARYVIFEGPEVNQCHQGFAESNS
jgi:hypothetical protein